jgi:exodeoxyribonuclease VII large subunit
MNCFTVSQLGQIARSLLSETFGNDTWVTGEIHGYKMHDRSGHAYFDLVEKDPDDPARYIAKIGCAFFKNSLLSWRTKLRREGFSSFQLADGLEVKLRAGVDLYVKEGRYQLIVSEVDAGYSLGAMARKRQQTIDELKKAGLFENNRRLEMSDCPLKIGLITSLGSAAFNDFLSVLNSSGYAFKLYIFDAYMQGEHTPRDVSNGIKALQQKDLHAIAIVRGGGAKTDLFYFDDIRICEAIAGCRLPVLTGIGHEIDLSVSDMVAYKHFVTPTDTARFLTARLDDFQQRIIDALSALDDSARSYTEKENDRLKMIAYRMSVSVSKMTRALDTSIHAAAGRLGMAAARASALAGNRLAIIERSVKPAVRAIMSTAESRLIEYDNLLAIMDPASILKRGFSITMTPEGKALTDSAGIQNGDRLKTVLLKGSLTSIVEAKEN